MRTFRWAMIMCAGLTASAMAQSPLPTQDLSAQPLYQNLPRPSPAERERCRLNRPHLNKVSRSACRRIRNGAAS